MTNHLRTQGYGCSHPMHDSDCEFGCSNPEDPDVVFVVEARNKISRGRCIGTVYMVRRLETLISGNVRNSLVIDCKTEQFAIELAAHMNQQLGSR